MFTIPLHLLQRIPAFMDATDPDRTCAALSGVFLKIEAGTLLLAATDGKLLVEEKYTVAGIGGESLAVILAPDGIESLKVFLKTKVKARILGDFTLAPTGSKAVALTATNGDLLSIRCIESIFPAYGSVFEKRPLASVDAVVGLNLQFLVRLAKVWGKTEEGSTPVRTTTLYGGPLLIEPLKQTLGHRRAIVMPINLPKVEDGAMATPIRKKAG